MEWKITCCFYCYVRVVLHLRAYNSQIIPDLTLFDFILRQYVSYVDQPVDQPRVHTTSSLRDDNLGNIFK